MSESFACDMKMTFWENVDRGIVSASLLYPDLDDLAIHNVVCTVRRNLRLITKGECPKNHRYKDGKAAMYERVWKICEWYMAEKPETAESLELEGGAALSSFEPWSAGKLFIAFRRTLRCFPDLYGSSFFPSYLKKIRERYFPGYVPEKQACTNVPARTNAPIAFKPPKPPRRVKPKPESFLEGFALYDRPLSLAAAFGIKPPAVTPNFNVRTGNQVAILMNEGGVRGLSFQLVDWGGSTYYRNLRSGGYARKTFENRRCLVPINGFYLWQRQCETGKPTVPVYVQPAAPDTMFAMAGIRYEHKNTPHPSQGFSIITVPAPPSTKHLKNTLPMLLPSSVWASWLEPGKLDRSVLDEMAYSCNDVSFSLRQVDGYFFFKFNGKDVRCIMSKEDIEEYRINDSTLIPLQPGCSPSSSWSILNIHTLPTKPSFAIPYLTPSINDNALLESGKLKRTEREMPPFSRDQRHPGYVFDRY